MANDIVTINSQSDFLAFIRDQAMPNGNLSIRGVARCCGVDESAFRNGVFKGAELASHKLAQTLTAHGFYAAEIEDGFPAQAVWLCIEYYAFDSRAKAPMAKQLARTFGSIGVMSVLKELTQPKELPAIANGPSKELIAAREIRELTDLLEDNPRLAQCLTDSIVNRVLERTLPGTTTPQLRGVVEIAHEMGFKTDESSRVKLGKFIKAQGFTPQKESRICNGVLTPINCYPDTPELRSAISLFFD
jgi:hypothetical protein